MSRASRETRPMTAIGDDVDVGATATHCPSDHVDGVVLCRTALDLAP